MRALSSMIGSTVAAILIAVSVVGCSPAGAATTAPTSAALAVAPFLIRTPAVNPQACMDALMTGKLVQHPMSGLGVSSPNDQPMAVEWPFRYSARIVDGRVELLDETGKVVAREGDQVSMGGGFGNLIWHACGPVSIAQPEG
jgi:hypothetical protein